MTGTSHQATALSAFAAALSACGVRDAILSPGSRSAPLILALARAEGLTAHSVIDERSAGFFALGTAKASGFPAVVACTSGTAAAELAPAVHEAREARTPLLVITADRPAELRAAGDNQTIDQIGVFGSAAETITAPRFEGTALADWEVFARELVEATLRPFPGPVHVNMQLWDPLAAEAEPIQPCGQPSLSPFEAQQSAAVSLPSGRTVVIAGRDEFGFDAGLSAAAEAASLPVFADPLSPVAQTPSANVIENWDSLLRVEEWAEKHRPDVILRTGDLPTSKALREWISASAAAGAQVLHFDPLDSRRDPSSVNTARYASALAPSITAGPRGDDLWLNEWRAADAVAAATLTAKASQPLALSEPQITACITSALSNRDLLFVAASMPVRDIESFGLLKDGPRVYANRGANGIDGTIASAAGLASASGQPTVLLLGDVTFAHDVASLATLRSVSTPFLGIVVNNGGGAIFDGLAIAAAGATYEEFVFTPPRLNIPAACEAWGLEHSLGTTIEELESALESLSSLAAPKILELTLDRKTSPAHRAELRAAVSAALLSS